MQRTWKADNVAQGIPTWRNSDDSGEEKAWLTHLGNLKQYWSSKVLKGIGTLQIKLGKGTALTQYIYHLCTFNLSLDFKASNTLS